MRLLDGRADGKAVALGKGDVEQRELVAEGACWVADARDGLGLRADGIDGVPFRGQKLGQGVDDKRVVFNKEDACGHEGP